MVSVARELSRFLAVEACGQCPPCKTGSIEITERLLSIEQGDGSDNDLGVINARLRTVTDANRCYLGTEEQNVVSSILRAFPEAFAARLEGTAGGAAAGVRAAGEGHRRRRHRHLRRAPPAQAAGLDVPLTADIGVAGPARRGDGKRDGAPESVTSAHRLGEDGRAHASISLTSAPPEPARRGGDYGAPS